MENISGFGTPIELFLTTMVAPSMSEKLYTRARKIVIGKMMTISMDEHPFAEFKREDYYHRMENISGFSTPIEQLLMKMAIPILPEKLEFSPLKLTSDTR